jgi:hypothetical protein
MGIKIVELSGANVITNSDLLPISQLTPTSRDTNKVSTAALKAYVNADVNKKLNDLENEIDKNYIDPLVLTTYVELSGDTMTGNLNMNGNEIQNFSAIILEYTSSITLSAGHNGSIIMMNRPAGVGETAPIANVTISDSPKLPTGFNVMLIQTGDSKVKVSTSGTVTVNQSDSALYTRKKYSQINLCVIKQDPYTVWLSGDMVG